MSAHLAAEGLRLALSGAFVLGDVDLALARGERLVVLGPSGCGKTTLLRCLCGLDRPDAGRVLVDGRDVTALPPERRDVGYVPQAATLFPHLDVAGNVAFGLRSRGLCAPERRRKTAEALDLLRIAPLAARRPTTLSGGEAKRVALARSLALRPAALLLDEPLAMLDGRARDGMVEVLRDLLAATGTTTVHVTHDREEAWLLAGRCAVMDGGRIRQEGPIDEVFRRPRSRFVAEFLGGSNVLPAAYPDPVHAVVSGVRLPLAAPARGTAGHVLLRPEDLEPAPGPAEAQFRGTLVAAADRGAFASLRVRLPDGTTLVAHVAPAAARGLAVPGAIALRCRAPAHPLPEA